MVELEKVDNYTLNKHLKVKKLKLLQITLAQAMLPFSYQQLNRLYQAATDKPSDRGEFFEVPDELLGFAGYRAVKVDPVRSMGLKIADYQRGTRRSKSTIYRWCGVCIKRWA